MRRLTTVFLAATLTSCAGAATAYAQARPAVRPNPQPRARAMINGGYQPSTTGVISHFSVDSPGTVTSSVPHPFFLQRYRQVTGEAEGMRREETAIHFQAQYQLPPFGRLHVVLAGGPSLIDVKQTLVIDVNYAEEFPYDTATFTGVDSKRGTGTATGFNAGVDFQWMFNPKLGAGALVRITKATLDLNVDNRIIQVDAGGTQIAAGIRLAF